MSDWKICQELAKIMGELQKLSGQSDTAAGGIQKDTSEIESPREDLWHDEHWKPLPERDAVNVT